MSKCPRLFAGLFAFVLVVAVGCGSPEVDAAEVDAVSAAEGHDGDHDVVSHDGEHAVAHEGEHHASGPPVPDVRTTVSSLIVFLIFAALLAKMAWKPLGEGLAAREQNIRGAMVEAQQARDEAAKARDEHSKRMANVDAEVKEIIAEARRDAEHTAAEIKSKAEADADATKTRALAEIERAKDAAIVELAARERDLIADATETVLGRAITDDDRSRLIEEAVSQFGQGA